MKAFLNRRRLGSANVGVIAGLVLVLFYIVIALFSVYCYVGNIIAFAHCDFKAPYKGEIIHGLGIVVPPASYVTVWFNDK